MNLLHIMLVPMFAVGLAALIWLIFYKAALITVNERFHFRVFVSLLSAFLWFVIAIGISACILIKIYGFNLH